MAIEKIKVPDLGDAIEVEVIEMLVSVGDRVEENDSLLVLESDKAAMEIPAGMNGVIKEIAVKLGDQVKTGDPMVTLETEQGSAEAGAGEDTGSDQTPEKAPEPAPEAASSSGGAEQGAAPQESRISQIDVPDLGTDDEVDVIEIHVKEGDEIAVDDALLTLESDKAAMEVPATEAGKIESLLLGVGDKVKTGSPILKLIVSGTTKPAAAPAAGAPAESSSGESEPAAPAPQQPERGGQSVPVVAASSSEGSGKGVYAGPAVRKLARELGVDLTKVPGTGAKSRILKEDVHEFVKSRLAAAPAGMGTGPAPIPDIDFSQFGDVERVERTKLEKITAANMVRNWNAVPHVFQFNEADVTELEEFRNSLKGEAEKRGSRLTPLPFLLKACAQTLAKYPQFNVSLHSSGEYVIQKKYCHIGVAVATPAGLLVPVIRDVDKKGLWQLADEVIEVSEKAKQRKLKPEEMQGACFTISSLGAIGGTGFTPIINAPEVAILGVGKTDTKPVFIDGGFQPRKMLPLTLSYDHRAVNGVDGGLFADYLVGVLSDIRRLLL